MIETKIHPFCCIRMWFPVRGTLSNQEGTNKLLLYLSSAINDERFAGYLKLGFIRTGHQAQRFNSLLIRGLATHVPVCAISNPPYETRTKVKQVDEVGTNNVHYITLGTNQSRLHKIVNYFAMKKAAKYILQKNRPEAIVCDAINPLASLVAITLSRKYKIPVIAIVTDIPEYMCKGKPSFFIRLTSQLMKKYDAYIFLSEAMNSLVNINKCSYIIMEGVCEENEEEITQSRNETCEGRRVIVYTGSLSPGTGLEELLEGFSRLNDACNANLHIYGSGKLVDMIREHERQCPSIRYMGIVNNKEAIHAQRNADLLINPRPANISYGNVSFPSKIMEYMASGTPVLTTRLPGIPDEYFKYMYTIEDDSAEGIAKALKKTLDIETSQRKVLGSHAKNFVVQKKNNVAQAARVLKLVREI